MSFTNDDTPVASLSNQKLSAQMPMNKGLQPIGFISKLLFFDEPLKCVIDIMRVDVAYFHHQKNYSVLLEDVLRGA